MIETQWNMFDLAVIGVMAISCLIAFFRGLIKEILSLVAWIGAAVVAVYYYAPAAEFMQAYFKSKSVAGLAAGLSLYIGALIVFSIINLVIIKTIKQGGETGMLDNMLGLLFGAFRGAFIISLAFFMITLVVAKDEYPDWIKESVTHPYAEKGALILTRIAPERMAELSGLHKKAKEEAEKRLREREENGVAAPIEYGEGETR
ncbi:MAG: CvpA family protein [Rickettsiales bacterium]|jgi:membrane protein required for colicin V production|nr:CvpA family protein [Rickettsiales bacterium]